MGQPRSLFVYFRSFGHQFYVRIVDFSVIQTHIVEVECELIYHLTTTMAQYFDNIITYIFQMQPLTPSMTSRLRILTIYLKRKRTSQEESFPKKFTFTSEGCSSFFIPFKPSNRCQMLPIEPQLSRKGSTDWKKTYEPVSAELYLRNDVAVVAPCELVWLALILCFDSSEITDVLIACEFVCLLPIWSILDNDFLVQHFPLAFSRTL